MIPLPATLDEAALDEWLDANDTPADREVSTYAPLARAVRALVEAKVREAVDETRNAIDHTWCECDNSGTGGRIHVDFEPSEKIVSRVMGGAS